jgi:predicted RNA-binding Zn ribbon-like protein
MIKLSTVSSMTLDGGATVLDFINSGYDREQEVITERLNSYDDLLILSERLHLFEPGELQQLKAMAKEKVQEAQDALLRVLQTRELLYRLFYSLPRDQQTDEELLTKINGLFAEAVPYRQINIRDNCSQFIFQWQAAGLLAPLWKLVLTAYDFLLTADLKSVRQCQGCAWLFYDRTKNQRKKWCSMESCGNSHKTKRYYAHRKKITDHSAIILL